MYWEEEGLSNGTVKVSKLMTRKTILKALKCREFNELGLEDVDSIADGTGLFHDEKAEDSHDEVVQKKRVFCLLREGSILLDDGSDG